jgi:hypothetical protein
VQILRGVQILQPEVHARRNEEKKKKKEAPVVKPTPITAVAAPAVKDTEAASALKNWSGPPPSTVEAAVESAGGPLD